MSDEEKSPIEKATDKVREMSRAERGAVTIIVHILTFLLKAGVMLITAAILQLLWNVVVWKVFDGYSRQVTYGEMLGVYLFVQMLFKFHNVKFEGS